MKMTVEELIEQLKQMDKNAVVQVACGDAIYYWETDIELAQEGNYVKISEA